MKKTLKMERLKIQELLSRDQMKSIVGGYTGCGICSGGQYACYIVNDTCRCPIGGYCM